MNIRVHEQITILACVFASKYSQWVPIEPESQMSTIDAVVYRRTTACWRKVHRITDTRNAVTCVYSVRILYS